MIFLVDSLILLFRYVHHMVPWREETTTSIMTVNALSCSSADDDDIYLSTMFTRIEKLLDVQEKITIVDVGPAFGQCILPLVATFGVEKFEAVVLVEPVAALREVLRRSVVHHGMQDVVKILPGIAHENAADRLKDLNYDGNTASIIPCQDGLVGSCMRVVPINLAMPKILPQDDCEAHPHHVHGHATKFEDDFPATRVQYSSCNVVAPPLPIYDLLSPLLTRQPGSIIAVDFLAVFPTVNVGSWVTCAGENILKAKLVEKCVGTNDGPKYTEELVEGIVREKCIISPYV